MTSYTPIEEEIGKSKKRPSKRLRPISVVKEGEKGEAASESRQPGPCQLCGGLELSPFQAHEGCVLWFCKPCELYQYGPLPDEKSYQGEYHTGYSKSFQRKVRSALVRLSYVRKHLPKRKETLRMLDVGCSIGASVKAGEILGWNSAGVDVSKKAVKECESRGLHCYEIHGDHLPFQEETFDLLTAWHVIEHVPSVQKTLKEWHRVLRKGGIVALATPDASSPKVRKLGKDYPKFWAPEHIYTFTPKNLSAFAERVGFEAVPMESEADLSGMPASVWFHETFRRWIENLNRVRGTWKEFCLILKKK